MICALALYGLGTSVGVKDPENDTFNLLMNTMDAYETKLEWQSAKQRIPRIPRIPRANPNPMEWSLNQLNA